MQTRLSGDLQSTSTTISFSKRYFPTGFKTELKCLLELFFPCLFTNAFRFLNPLISLVMCGHLNKLEFGAASLAYSIINIFGENVDLGFSTAFDTLFSQIYGSKHKKKMGLLLQRAILVMTLIYIVLICFHINMEPILILLKQDPLMAKLTAKYITLYLPGLFFDFQFLALSRYLQNQDIVYPMMISALCSNVFNLVCQYVTIFNYGYGIEASACILSMANFMMFMIQLCYVLISGVYKDTWDGFSFRDSLENWKILFLLGLPGILMFSLKEWTFEVSTFIAGSINSVQLGAQSVAFQCITIAFTMTVGLGISVTIRVGQYLGSNQIDRLKTFLRTAAVVAITSSTGCFILILTLRKYIAALFSNDLDIQKEASNLLVYASFFQLIDVVLVIFAGVLKASGRQFIGACTMFFCHYFVGIPIGVALIFAAKLNIEGMWVGLIVATTVEGLIFGYIMYRTNWKVECQKASINTEHFENATENEFKMSIYTTSKECLYEKGEQEVQLCKTDKSKRSFKKTIFIRCVTLTCVLLLLVMSVLIRVYIPRSTYDRRIGITLSFNQTTR